MTSSFRSILLIAYTTGISPTTLKTPWTQSSSSFNVELRVRSHTARTPFAPWKNASFRRSRKPFSPMMSHTVMSIWSFEPLSGRSNVISRFETFAPSVVMYRSSNSSWTNRRMREVFPTAASPTRQIFVLIRWTSAIERRRPIPLGLLKGSAIQGRRGKLFGPPAPAGDDADRAPADRRARRDRRRAGEIDRASRGGPRRRAQGELASRPRGRPRDREGAGSSRVRPVRLQGGGHPEHQPPRGRAGRGRGRVGDDLPRLRRRGLRAGVRRGGGPRGRLRRHGIEPSRRAGVHGEVRGGVRPNRGPRRSRGDHRAGHPTGPRADAPGDRRHEADPCTRRWSPRRSRRGRDRGRRRRRNRRPGDL